MNGNKTDLNKALRAIISACESLTISPRGLKSLRPIHFVPVPRATTSKSILERNQLHLPNKTFDCPLKIRRETERKEKEDLEKERRGERRPRL